MKATEKEMKRMIDLLRQIKSATAQLESMMADIGIEASPTEVFNFCSVHLHGTNLSYRVPEGMDLHAGDMVKVPFGKNNTICTGSVVSVGEYLRENAPWPPEKAKFVREKF